MRRTSRTCLHISRLKRVLLWAGLALAVLGAETFAPPYLDYLGNVATITSALQTFGAMEKRFPKTFDELERSPYFMVAPKNFLNPYTGKPLQDTSEVSLGDIGFVSTPEGVVLRIYYRPGESGDLETSELTYSKHDLDLWTNLAANREKTMEPVKNIQALSEKARTAFFNCEQLRETVYRATLDPYPKGELSTWDTLTQNHRILNWSIRNPFTGGIAKDVATPSPGDFTYRMFYFNGQFSPIFVCYGEKGKPVSSSAAMMMDALKDFQYKPPKGESSGGAADSPPKP